MQFHQTVDEAFAQGFGALGIEAQLRRDVRAQDDPFDPVHQVELAADQAFVGAVQVRLGAVRKTAVELIEDTKLTGHVVR